MEEEKGSVVSSSKRDGVEESSDSDSITQPFPSSKCARPGPSVPASKFKGVVLQQNGHWGAQIYANHQRIWLGTFRTEHEAAMAYDSAAIRVRAGDSHRNFPWTTANIAEPEFQSHYRTEALLSMIRDGTYPYKLTDYLSTCGNGHETTSDPVLSMARVNENGGVKWRPLFQKELTPSDVGKLNRVVIPKRYALKYFPAISELAEENADDKNRDNVKDVELVFYDKFLNIWKFRYCYWSSSQSFVLTRGWNRFAKENKLKANDVITFYMCEYKDKDNELKSFCVIDVNQEERTGALVEKPAKRGVPYVDLELCLGYKDRLGEEERTKIKEEEGEEVKEDGERKGFKLFGVQIR